VPEASDVESSNLASVRVNGCEKRNAQSLWNPRAKRRRQTKQTKSELDFLTANTR
jgi:hypothetical protein